MRQPEVLQEDIVSHDNGFVPLKKEDLENYILKPFEEQVALNPSKIAVKAKDATHSYRTLNQTANLVALAVKDHYGVGGNAVALMFTHGAKMVAAFLGVIKSGNFVVPMDPTFPKARSDYVLQDSMANIILTDSKYISQAQEYSKDGIKVFNIDELEASSELPNPSPQITPETIIQLIYTSGSTGEPKGVIMDHRYVVRTTKNKVNLYKISAREHLTMLTSITYGGAHSTMLAGLSAGATLYPYGIREEGLSDFPDWLKREKITVCQVTPTVFRYLVDSLPPGETYPDIRLIKFGGEAVLKRDVELFREYFPPNAHLRVGLASSEAATISVDFIGNDTKVDFDVMPAGIPLDDVEVFLWDESGNEVEQGEVGEIVVRGEHISPGYWQRPDLMEAVFLPDPEGGSARLCRTGDLAKFLPDGRLLHMGRKDQQLKIRGMRVEVSEVENHLFAYPDVKEAVVVGRGDDPKRKRLIAYIKLKHNRNIDIQELRNFLSKRLPTFMVPTRYVVLDSMPTTSTGKIDRKALPNPDLSDTELQSGKIFPRDAIEEKLTKIWQDVMGIKSLGVTDDFFLLGGDSLTAAQLFLKIEEVFERKLPLSILLKAATVRQQADILRWKGFKPDWSPIVSIQTQGDLAPLFCFAGKGGNPLRFRQLAQHLGEDRPIYFLQSRGISGAEKPYDRVEEIAADYLAEMQKVQPSGPYFLCGSSFGGLVAYEIAQQLLAQNEEVGLLSLLDTYAPSYLKFKPDTMHLTTRIIKLLAYIRKQIDNLIISDRQSKRANIQYYREMLPKLFGDFKYRISMSLENLRYHSIPPELKQVESANKRASRNYLPLSFSGRAVLFRATHLPLGAPPDPELGWGDVGIAEFVIHDVDSFHGNILFEPAVSRVAEIMSGYLGG